MKKQGYRRKITFEKKQKHWVSSGFARVMGRPARLIGFCRVVTPASLLTNPNRSSHQVDPPGWSKFENCGLELKFVFYKNISFEN